MRALSRFVTLLLALCLIAPVIVRAEQGHAQRPKGVAFETLFQLVTQDGRKLTRADLKGQPYAVFFGFTNCPDVCPTTLLEMSGHLEAIGPAADRLKVFFVTIDPERDTADKLKAYLGSFDKRITGLTGSSIDIEAAAHAFGAFFEKAPSKSGEGYSMDHTLNVYLVDKYGLLAGHIRATDTPEKARDLMKRLLAQ